MRNGRPANISQRSRGRESGHSPERAPEQSLDPQGKNRGPGKPLPPLYDRPVDSNEERGGNFLDLECAGQLTFLIEQQGEIEMPVVA